MGALKYVKDPGPILFENVFGEPLDADGRTEEAFNATVVHSLSGKLPSWSQRSMTFGEFVLSRLLDPRFCKSMEAILLAVDVKQAVRDMEKTGWLALPRKHWEELAAATEKPDDRYPYPSGVAHCMAPHMLALVKQAVDELPPDTVRAGNGAEATA